MYETFHKCISAQGSFPEKEMTFLHLKDVRDFSFGNPQPVPVLRRLPFLKRFQVFSNIQTMFLVWSTIIVQSSCIQCNNLIL